MKRDDLILFIIGLLLLAGMLITILFGGEKSLHGVGTVLDNPLRLGKTLTGVATRNLCQSQSITLKFICLIKESRTAVPLLAVNCYSKISPVVIKKSIFSS